MAGQGDLATTTIANPLTAAITGFGIGRRLVRPANPFFGTHIGLPEPE
jgi:hypothetical protein